MKFLPLIAIVSCFGAPGTLASRCKPEPPTSTYSVQPETTSTSESASSSTTEPTSSSYGSSSSSATELASLFTEAISSSIEWTSSSTTEAFSTVTESSVSSSTETFSTTTESSTFSTESSSSIPETTSSATELTTSSATEATTFTTIVSVSETTTESSAISTAESTSSTTSSSSAPTPTILNGGFDDSSTSYSPWTSTIPGTASAYLTTSNVKSAPNALAVTYPVGSARAYFSVSQKLETAGLTAGTYTLSGWARSDVLYIDVRGCSSFFISCPSGTVVQYSTFVSGYTLTPGVFGQMSTICTFTDAQIAAGPSVQLNGGNCGAGNYAFDDITITQN